MVWMAVHRYDMAMLLWALPNTTSLVSSTQVWYGRQYTGMTCALPNQLTTEALYITMHTQLYYPKYIYNHISLKVFDNILLMSKWNHQQIGVHIFPDQIKHQCKLLGNIYIRKLKMCSIKTVKIWLYIILELSWEVGFILNDLYELWMYREMHGAWLFLFLKVVWGKTWSAAESYFPVTNGT